MHSTPSGTAYSPVFPPGYDTRIFKSLLNNTPSTSANAPFPSATSNPDSAPHPANAYSKMSRTPVPIDTETTPSHP